MIHLSLILPVYNGAAILESTLETAWRWLAQQGYDSEIVVVDDGSSDETPRILERELARRAGSDRVRLRGLRNEPNQGKGAAVRRGMLEAEGAYRLFCDVDLTYPIEDCARVLAALETGADLAIASRMHPESRYVIQADFLRYVYTRHTMGRVFNRLVRLFVVGGVRDTQAGLKGANAEATRELFPVGRMTRFSFDVELLYLAKRRGRRVVEVPVEFLYRKEPSTVHFFRDSFRMVVDMFRIRWRGWRGHYERESASNSEAASATSTGR